MIIVWKLNICNLLQLHSVNKVEKIIFQYNYIFSSCIKKYKTS